ncbi:AlbA family DNA-binding domain-containing protein [Alicyclobacillus suci]|uniref:AlbA family DNA-binding domain-containing protein n=1 Tax=Alicyclobacillus suci TaxID=2816080 RepID=UPI001A8D7094|nr:ATP-binding protein [Alicyclobacillus suci]
MLDYKMEIGDDSKEFMADITSFANTDGGVILYGIEERKEDGKNTGIPAQIVGIEKGKADFIQQKIENMLRDNVDPRLPNVIAHPIDVSGRTVLAIGVPRSLFAPHMVRKDSKFYARNSISKFPMDTHQIRQAMLQSVGWEKEADNFRRSRIMDMMAGKIAYLRQKERATFLHIVPLGTNRPLINLREYTTELAHKFKPYQYSGCNQTFNLDGYLIWPGSPGESYVQFYRNGATEFCTATLFYETEYKRGQIALDGMGVEFFVVRSAKEYLGYCERLGVEPPFAMFLSIVGAKGHITGQHVVNAFNQRALPASGLIEENEIMFPPVIVETPDMDLPALFRMTFDMLWQAAGRDGSPHYKEDGSWGLSLK